MMAISASGHLTGPNGHGLADTEVKPSLAAPSRAPSAKVDQEKSVDQNLTLTCLCLGIKVHFPKTLTLDLQ